MRMFEIEISVGDDYVVIRPEQAELLCKWIIGVAESPQREG